MASSTHTTDRRDAAVTAALAGAVVVILGYASGIGLRPASVVTATLPAPSTAITSTPAPVAAPTPIAVAAPVPISVPAIPAAARSTRPQPPTPAPRSTPPSPVVATPSAPSAPPSCPPGLVGSLAGALPVVGDVSTLLAGLLGPGGLSSTATATGSGDVLSCTLGTLLGSSCCEPASTNSMSSRAR